MRKIIPTLGLLLATFALSGCNEFLTEGTADAAGIAGAGIAASVTKDATVGAAIGLGVQSVAMTGLRYVERRVHRAEQDRIAAIAGTMEPGAVQPWSIVHDVPIEDDEQGEVTVVRDIGGTGGLACKEIVFSVVAGKAEAVRHGFFTATVCEDGTVWKWATAEPATERWGSLQ